ETLRSLAAVGNSLDGIRMRAVVESAEVTGPGAIVTVQWQTDQYTQQDSSGADLETFPSNTGAIDIKLLETDQGWKFQDFNQLHGAGTNKSRRVFLCGFY